MFFQINPYEVISILVETLIYGAFVILFVLSTILLLQRRKWILREKVREDGNGRLRALNLYLVLSVLMFCTITAKWCFRWPEVLPIPSYDTIISNAKPPPQIPRLSRTAYRFKEACIQATVILGDSIIVYRLWILSNRRKFIVALPILGIIGFIACAIALSGPYNDTDKNLIPIQASNGKIKLTVWDIGATAVTLGITIYCTLIISWIILQAKSCAGVRLGGHGLQQALAVIVESAAMSATWNLLYFIAGLGFQSQLALVILDSLPGIYGISTMLLNVRVGLGFAFSHQNAPILRSRSLPQPRLNQNRNRFLKLFHWSWNGDVARDIEHGPGIEGLGIGVGVGGVGGRGYSPEEQEHSNMVFTTQIDTGISTFEVNDGDGGAGVLTVARDPSTRASSITAASTAPSPA